VNNIEPASVSFTVSDNTSTTHVTSTSDHDDVTGVELHEVDDFILLQVELEGVVYPDEGIRVSDGAPVVSDDVGHTLCTNSDLSDLEKLVGGLLRGDAVDGETSFDVVKETEMLARPFDGDNIHETSRVSAVRPYFTVNLYQPLVHDSGNFTSVQSILQAVAKEDCEGEGFAKLVGTRGGTGSVSSGQLVEHP